jgi:hypothetical protein
VAKSVHLFLSTFWFGRLFYDFFFSYALAVFENSNLRQIFDIEKQPLTIEKGSVQFQNNPMLCYHKIETLIDHLDLGANVTEIDVSQYSNGDKAICTVLPEIVNQLYAICLGDEMSFEVNITALNFAFMLDWVAFNTSNMDHRKFLGYQVFYKKVDGPDPNLSIDDERSACADSSVVFHARG